MAMESNVHATACNFLTFHHTMLVPTAIQVESSLARILSAIFDRSCPEQVNPRTFIIPRNNRRSLGGRKRKCCSNCLTNPHTFSALQAIHYSLINRDIEFLY